MSILISDSFKIRESTSDEWKNIQFAINPPGVPTGGAIGQVLAKNSTTNYDTEWIDLSGIPTGGAAGKVLVKASATNYDVTWGDAGVQIYKASLTIPYASWAGNDPYMQTVTISGATITANTKVDIQSDATAIAQLVTDGVTALFIENNNGTLTVYAIGAATTADVTVQVTYYETV